MATKVYTNKFAGTCISCRNRVEAGAGATFRDARDKWVVQHNAGACPPAAAPAAPKAPAQNAEPGYYIRNDGRAIVVVKSRSTDRTYGKILTFHGEGKRPTWDYVPGAGYSVADLRPMNAHDAGMMGLAHGFCIFCCAPLGGETLSAQVAALIGYGERCAHTRSLPFPRGVKAQRAYMESNGR